LRARCYRAKHRCHSAEQRNKLAPFPMKFIATKAAEQLDQQALHREVPWGRIEQIPFVMFCNLVGSTGISAQLDAEERVGAYLDAASAAVTEMAQIAIPTKMDRKRRD
jgi:hypothetical protein